MFVDVVHAHIVCFPLLINRFSLPPACSFSTAMNNRHLTLQLEEIAGLITKMLENDFLTALLERVDAVSSLHAAEADSQTDNEAEAKKEELMVLADRLLPLVQGLIQQEHNEIFSLYWQQLESRLRTIIKDLVLSFLAEQSEQKRAETAAVAALPPHAAPAKMANSGQHGSGTNATPGGAAPASFSAAKLAGSQANSTPAPNGSVAPASVASANAPPANPATTASAATASTGSGIYTTKLGSTSQQLASWGDTLRDLNFDVWLALLDRIFARLLAVLRVLVESKEVAARLMKTVQNDLLGNQGAQASGSLLGPRTNVDSDNVSAEQEGVGSPASSLPLSPSASSAAAAGEEAAMAVAAAKASSVAAASSSSAILAARESNEAGANGALQPATSGRPSLTSEGRVGEAQSPTDPGEDAHNRPALASTAQMIEGLRESDPAHVEGVLDDVDLNELDGGGAASASTHSAAARSRQGPDSNSEGKRPSDVGEVASPGQRQPAVASGSGSAVAADKTSASGTANVFFPAAGGGPRLSTEAGPRVQWARLQADNAAAVEKALEEVHQRCSKLIQARSRDGADTGLAASSFIAYFQKAHAFVRASEALCNCSNALLRGTLLSQARAFLDQFHARQCEKLRMILNNEQWNAVRPGFVVEKDTEDGSMDEDESSLTFLEEKAEKSCAGECLTRSSS